MSLHPSISIIAKTFDANPSVNTVIGAGGNRAKKIKRLAEFAYIKAKNRDGVYLSKNGKGAALAFRSNLGGFSFKEQWYEIRLAFSLPVKKIIETLKREAYIKKHRANEGDYLYFWFLGVEEGGGNAVFELKDQIFDLADKENLPIFLETSVDRNVLAYERYGFETYHEWYDEKNDVNLRFMRREVEHK